MLVLALEFSRDASARGTRPPATTRAGGRARTGRLVAQDPRRTARRRRWGATHWSLPQNGRAGPGAAAGVGRRRTGSPAGFAPRSSPGAPSREWEAVRRPLRDGCSTE